VHAADAAEEEVEDEGMIDLGFLIPLLKPAERTVGVAMSDGQVVEMTSAVDVFGEDPSKTARKPGKAGKQKMLADIFGPEARASCDSAAPSTPLKTTNKGAKQKAPSEVQHLLL
jgi:hypothetical protein